MNYRETASQIHNTYYPIDILIYTIAGPKLTGMSYRGLRKWISLQLPRGLQSHRSVSMRKDCHHL